VLEYDGTGFHGFQRQPGVRTVQETLEEHLAQVCGAPVQVVGAGRTDAGVHALGQVVHFDLAGGIPVQGLERALNRGLGPELAVRHVQETGAEFHARFSAVRRTYHYRVSRERPSPFLARYVVHDRYLRQDAGERIRAALPGLLGKQDFAVFAAAGETRPTVRTVFAAELKSWGPHLRLDLAADAFLRSMARRIAGLLLEIGRGREEPEAPARLLAERLPGRAWATAPPHGLVLARVEYPDGYPPPGAAPWEGLWTAET
jgi:tRNA pseudouridine38-40 synthase